MRCLVVGGTGTVGSRVCSWLRSDGHDVRAASRSTTPPLRWDDPGTWPSALEGAEAMYLLLPDDVFLPDGFLAAARRAGVRRIVAQSDRYADVMRVEPLLDLENKVKTSGLDWCLVRPGWFHQDLETFFRGPLLDGLLSVPVGDAPQSWVDADDIAAVGATALCSPDWDGQTLVVTGPCQITMSEVVHEVAAATGRDIHFDGSRDTYAKSLAEQRLDPLESTRILDNFARLVAEGDARPTTTVAEVTGRAPTSIHEYIATQARLGTWDVG